MEIIIGNSKYRNSDIDYGKIAYCGRPTSIYSAMRNYPELIDYSRLSNPFTQGTRLNMCRSFEHMFDRSVREQGSSIRESFTSLWNLYLQCRKEDVNLTLLCFCHPLKCHTETLREYLNKCYSMIE